MMLTGEAVLSDAADRCGLDLNQLVHEGLWGYWPGVSRHVLVCFDCFVEPICGFDTLSWGHVVHCPLLLLPHSHPQEERCTTRYSAHLRIKPCVQLKYPLRCSKTCELGIIGEVDVDWWRQHLDNGGLGCRRCG